jgi:hypothetical protein
MTLAFPLSRSPAKAGPQRGAGHGNVLRAVIALLLAALLGGCWWQGPVFYQPDPTAAAPITPGLYDVVDGDGKVERMRLARTATGVFVNPKDGKGSGGLYFVPFPLAGRDLWISEMIPAGPDTAEMAVYGLIERRADGIAAALIVDCEGNEALVRAAGGVVSGASDQHSTPGEGVNPTCTFNDEASLERAFAAFVIAHPHLETQGRLKRIGD